MPRTLPRSSACANAGQIVADAKKDNDCDRTALTLVWRLAITYAIRRILAEDLVLDLVGLRAE